MRNQYSSHKFNSNNNDKKIQQIRSVISKRYSTWQCYSLLKKNNKNRTITIYWLKNQVLSLMWKMVSMTDWQCDAYEFITRWPKSSLNHYQQTNARFVTGTQRLHGRSVVTTLKGKKDWIILSAVTHIQYRLCSNEALTVVDQGFNQIHQWGCHSRMVRLEI